MLHQDCIFDNRKNDIKNKSIQMYGFVSNPHQPTFVNTREPLRNTIIQQYVSRLVNMKSHNLCTKLMPPQGDDKLLGL